MNKNILQLSGDSGGGQLLRSAASSPGLGALILRYLPRRFYTTRAYEQSGVLTNAEVSLLLKLSASTVGTYRREWEEQHQRKLPTRGSIHDMGPTLTHKKIILQKLIFEGKNVQTVCREPTAGRSPAPG